MRCTVRQCVHALGAVAAREFQHDNHTHQQSNQGLGSIYANAAKTFGRTELVAMILHGYSGAKIPLLALLPVT
eukprot:scaffold278662_cov17-Prasinocladus_malaysianus.AAC.1